MFDPFEHTRRGNDDLDTSFEGAASVTPSASNQRDQLYAEFVKAGTSGLTDDEAAQRASLLDSNYWKRCGELRQEGRIRATDERRVGLKNVKRMVSVIADA